MNLFTLYADLALDASGFERGVQRASRQGGTLASSLRSGLGNASNVVINNMSAASVAVGNLLADVARATVDVGKELITTGIEYNKSMETYQTNFATMLGGSKEAAHELTAELQEMAAATPFAMTDLADATQTLLSFGQDSSTVLDTLQSLGDIAMGDKNKLASLTLAFAQASSSGKLMGQDLMQMINAGFNPLLTISEKTGAAMGDLKEFMSTGKMTNELRKSIYAARVEVAKLGDDASEGAKMLVQMYEDGAISAELLGQIFDIETSPGGRFYNAMENASKTISGLSATLSDDFTALTGKVLTPVTDWMRDKLLPSAIDAVGRLDAAFDVGGLKGLASEAIAIVKETFAEWGTIAYDAGTGLLANVLSGLTDDTVTKEEVQTTLSGIWSAGTTGLDNIIDSATTLWTDITTALGEDTTVGDKIAGVFQAFTSARANTLTSVSTLFADMYGQLTGDTEGADNIKNTLSGLFDGWEGAKNSMFEAAGSLFDTVYELLTGQEATADNVMNTIGGIFTAGIDTANELFGVADTFFSDIDYHLGSDESVGEKIKGIFDAGLDGIDGLVEASGTLLSEMYAAITNDEEGARNLKSFIGGLFPNAEQREAIWNMLFPTLDAEKNQEAQAAAIETYNIDAGTSSYESARKQGLDAYSMLQSLVAGGQMSESELDRFAVLLGDDFGEAFRDALEEALKLYETGGQYYSDVITSGRGGGARWAPVEKDTDNYYASDIILDAIDAINEIVAGIPGAIAAGLASARVEMDAVTVGNMVLPTVSAGIARSGRLVRKTGNEGGVPR